ncbi:MAG: DNA-binding protein, partial [Thermoplasmata archaeon]
MVAREVAWRVFAGEYNYTTYVETGSDERAPSYVVTPLGARINRLFIVGVLTDVENIGTDTEPMWRARVSDPTGVFYISAGQYQPEAAQILSTIKPPKFVAVVGKSRTYSPEEGVIYVSVRPET